MLNEHMVLLNALNQEENVMDSFGTDAVLNGGPSTVQCVTLVRWQVLAGLHH